MYTRFPPKLKSSALLFPGETKQKWDGCKHHPMCGHCPLPLPMRRTTCWDTTPMPYARKRSCSSWPSSSCVCPRLCPRGFQKNQIRVGQVMLSYSVLAPGVSISYQNARYYTIRKYRKNILYQKMLQCFCDIL